MLRIFIRLSKWLTLLNQSIVSLVRIFFVSGNSKLFRKQKSSANELVILGNGPSLKTTIESNRDYFLSNELVCVNHFAMSDFYTEFKPKYYVAIAHDLFLDNVKSELLEASDKLFNAIANKTTWKLKYFTTLEAKKHERWQKILERNINIEIIYLNLTPVEGFDSFMFHKFDKACGMPRPHNVMVPAIFVSLHLGVKRIVLVGADHTWLRELYVDENNRTMFFDKHFYDKERKLKFFNYDPDNYLKLHEIINSISSAFASYHILERYAQFKKREIVNATPDSFIDAFKRYKLPSYIVSGIE